MTVLTTVSIILIVEGAASWAILGFLIFPQAQKNAVAHDPGMLESISNPRRGLIQAIRHVLAAATIMLWSGCVAYAAVAMPRQIHSVPEIILPIICIVLLPIPLSSTSYMRPLRRIESAVWLFWQLASCAVFYAFPGLLINILGGLVVQPYRLVAWFANDI